MAYPETQMILVMDHKDLPQHIRQTFRLFPSERGTRWESDLTAIQVATEGEDINLSAAGYVVVYASNTWHAQAAQNLHDQIKSLRGDAVVVMIPVEVEEATLTKFIMPTPRVI